jgi:hypothetical protein
VAGAALLGLLRAGGERSCGRRTANKGNELAPFQMIELHPIFHDRWPDYRISNSRISQRVGQLFHSPPAVG